MISQHVGAKAITIKWPHMVFYGTTSDAIILLSQEYLALFKPRIPMLIINDFYDFTYTIIMHRKYKGKAPYFMQLWH